MIGSGDVYKVVTAVTPLYVALFLGYISVRWCHMFRPEHCDAINRFNCYFIMPFFCFDFTSNFNPYEMNIRFLMGEVISKLFIALGLVIWANLCHRGSYPWSVTSFSLATMNNTLVVGVPLLGSMYGDTAVDIVVQSFAIQSLLWFTTLLFLLELYRVKNGLPSGNNSQKPSVVEMKAEERRGDENPQGGEGGGDTTETTAETEGEDNASIVDTFNPPFMNEVEAAAAAAAAAPPPFWSVMRTVFLKVLMNPTCFACLLGIIWALIANRWDIKMPKIVEGSILIMSKAGSGVSMFSIGIFMALQEKVISCGVGLMVYGLFLRFVVGPAMVAFGCIVVGLRGQVLRIAILQAALPEAIAGFVFAQEYKLHATVLSTAVIFGTLVSLPLLIAYYATLEALH